MHRVAEVHISPTGTSPAAQGCCPGSDVAPVPSPPSSPRGSRGWSPSARALRSSGSLLGRAPRQRECRGGWKEGEDRHAEPPVGALGPECSAVRDQQDPQSWGCWGTGCWGVSFAKRRSGGSSLLGAALQSVPVDSLRVDLHILRGAPCGQDSCFLEEIHGVHP